MVFYLIAYMVTNLAAFGIITIVEREVKSDEISDYAGLARRSPGLGLGLLAAFLSLAGIPPFAGFVGKVLLILISHAQIWQSHGWLRLVIIGILNSILALYYYLRVIRSSTRVTKLPNRANVPRVPMKIAVSMCVLEFWWSVFSSHRLYNWLVTQFNLIPVKV